MYQKLFTVLVLGTVLASGNVSARNSSTPSTITYNGLIYNYSATSTCSDGTAALRYNRKWWCPVTATASTTPTTPPTTPTTTTTTTPTTTTTVPAPVAYSAHLSWTIPVAREDGTPLQVSELAGYELYYTTDSGSVSTLVPISGGSTVDTFVTGLPSGNYYFSISSIDSSGLKSALSPIATITFP